MTFTVGSLVKARGREWVVLPDSTDELIIVRPLGGTEDETTGILISLEEVEPAHFDLPDPSQAGDYRSCRFLRDAMRLSSRYTTGPFRSFGRISVQPKPYQLVPLLAALKLNPVRLLIADDVGIGKTIEACLIARELLDRGEIKRIAILCPPHLAEQWQKELKRKFHIDAELVLSSTARRLEQNTRIGQSLFEVYPFVVVSMDFIKSDRRRDEFVRSCPEFVIVDEAHTCAFGQGRRGGRHQRNELVSRISEDQSRHIILVSATPHSGKEETFRSLLSFIKPEFSELPDPLSGPENEHHRRKLASHFIQRMRADIRRYLDTDTPFPIREESEASYNLSIEYLRLFDRVLDYAREIVIDEEGGKRHQRVRWWSALALLRSLGSSPAAAASTLRNRAAAADSSTLEEADEIGRRSVLDLDVEDQIEGVDLVPGGDSTEDDEAAKKEKRKLRDLAREADKLCGGKDLKLTKLTEIINEFLDDGYRPILFCRYIPTADYLSEELRKRLSSDVNVISVTGVLPPADREARVLELSKSKKRVLVCTDCLSEGINLQGHFDAVIHYDLSWNPTRHEQRAGRVDRYGQPKEKIRVLTYYGVDNRIDGIVLDVLIRKHHAIRSSLGIIVPVPMDTNEVIEAIFEGLLLRQRDGGIQTILPAFDSAMKTKKDQLHSTWQNAADNEKRSRTMFSQETIKVDEVAKEFNATIDAIGSQVEVERFTIEALKSHGAVISPIRGGYKINCKEIPRALRDTIGTQDSFFGSFYLPVEEGVEYLERTHPVVEGIATYIIDTALDPIMDGIAQRAGTIRTDGVNTRTTLMLIRLRYKLKNIKDDLEEDQLAEETVLLGFTGPPENPTWIDDEDTDALITLSPTQNITPDISAQFVDRIINNLLKIEPHIQSMAEHRSKELQDAHTRVRAAARIKGIRYRIEPILPADILGIYVYLPAST